MVLYSALNVASAGLVALAASGDRLVRPLLAHPLTQWIGEISYGAYVYHSLAITLALKLLFPSLDAGSEPLPTAAKLVLFATAYGATIAAAALSYRCFESRFLRASARGPGPAIRRRSAPSPHPRRPDPVAAELVEAALTSRREPR